MALLTTWLNIESSYLAQLCTYTGATHTQEIMQLWTIFLKLLIFWKIHISHFVPPCIMYFEIHITMNSFCVACIYAYFNGNYFIGLFGIYANEPMQSWIVCHVASCIIVIGIVICGQPLQPQVWSQKLHIHCTCTCIS